MKDEELNALERDAKALHDPKDRAEALKAIATLRAADTELRETQAKFELERKAAIRTALRSPDFKNYSFRKAIKLIVGAFALLALFIALMFLVPPIDNIRKGNLSLEVFAILFIVLAAIAAISFVLYLLGRKPYAERTRIRANPVARQFAKQKLLFQISSLALILLAVIGIGISATLIKQNQAAPFVIAILFMFCYWLLGRKLWRCPACGKQLSFMNKHGDRQSIESCPNCHAQLQ